MLARPAVLALAMAAAVLALGCGGQGKVKEANRYVAEINTASMRFTDAITAVGTVGASGSTAENAAAAVRLNVAIDRVVGDLRAVEPPTRVARLHTQLIDALTSFDRSLSSARRGFRSRDAVTILEQRERLLTATQRVTARMNATTDAIDRALKS